MFVYTGTFYENLIYRNHVKYDKEQDIIEFKQPILLPETRCMIYISPIISMKDTKSNKVEIVAMLYVEKDLSTIVKAIFDQWDTKHEDLNHKYLYAMNARVAQREITEAIEKRRFLPSFQSPFGILYHLPCKPLLTGFTLQSLASK